MSPALLAYAAAHTAPEPPLLAQLTRETHLQTLLPRMSSGPAQGRLLSMLSHLLRPRRILEIGTFCGYATLCLGEGLAADGLLHTIEIDPEREARIRVRGYQARRAVHEHQQSRRRRDNVVAGIAVVVVAVLAVVAQVYFFNGGPGTPAPSSSATATPSATPTPTARAGANTGTVPPSTLAEGRTWTGTLGLNGIDLGIELDGAAAPQAVSSTISLVKADFYSDVTCHRLTTSGIFVLQCGDPAYAQSRFGGHDALGNTSSGAELF